MSTNTDRQDQQVRERLLKRAGRSAVNRFFARRGIDLYIDPEAPDLHASIEAWREAVRYKPAATIVFTCTFAGEDITYISGSGRTVARITKMDLAFGVNAWNRHGSPNQLVLELYNCTKQVGTWGESLQEAMAHEYQLIDEVQLALDGTQDVTRDPVQPRTMTGVDGTLVLVALLPLVPR